MFESNMTLGNIAILSGVMLIGGLLPSVSSLAVLSRSATSGFIHGVFTSLGIVLGDVFFILVAIFGLSLLTKIMGSLFVYIMYLGGAYLIWLGIKQWQIKSQTIEIQKLTKASLLSSFFTGLLITLADQKAILFYLGFFPVLFDLSKITFIDTSIIIVITILGLGSAKLCYAIVGGKAGFLIKNVKAIIILNKVSATIIIAVGLYIILKV